MAEEKKFLIVIQAGPQDMGRALHGLTYGQELYEAGFEVEIYFDGTGTKWIKEFEQTEHPFHPVFKSVKDSGIIKGACGYCSNYFHIGEDIQQVGIPLKEGAKDGHLSLAKHIKEGYTLVVM